MKLKMMTYIMTEDEIRQHPYISHDDKSPGFYRYLAEQLGYDWDNVTSIDCRKICIAPNILNAWYEDADIQHIDRGDFTMHLAISGPKCPNKESSGYELGEGEVTVEADAIEAETA